MLAYIIPYESDHRLLNHPENHHTQLQNTPWIYDFDKMKKSVDDLRRNAEPSAMQDYLRQELTDNLSNDHQTNDDDEKKEESEPRSLDDHDENELRADELKAVEPSKDSSEDELVDSNDESSYGEKTEDTRTTSESKLDPAEQESVGDDYLNAKVINRERLAVSKISHIVSNETQADATKQQIADSGDTRRTQESKQNSEEQESVGADESNAQEINREELDFKVEEEEDEAQSDANEIIRDEANLQDSRDVTEKQMAESEQITHKTLQYPSFGDISMAINDIQPDLNEDRAENSNFQESQNMKNRGESRSITEDLPDAVSSEDITEESSTDDYSEEATEESEEITEESEEITEEFEETTVESEEITEEFEEATEELKENPEKTTEILNEMTEDPEETTEIPEVDKTTNEDFPETTEDEEEMTESPETTESEEETTEETITEETTNEELPETTEDEEETTESQETTESEKETTENEEETTASEEKTTESEEESTENSFWEETTETTEAITEAEQIEKATTEVVVEETTKHRAKKEKAFKVLPSCGDLVCPKEAKYCRFQAKSLPPDFTQMLKVSECLSDTKVVLKSSEGLVGNQKPGVFSKVIEIVPVEHNQQKHINFGDFFNPNSE